MRLKKVVGIVLIVIGLGRLCFGEVVMYEYQGLTIDTDIESIVNGEAPLYNKTNSGLIKV